MQIFVETERLILRELLPSDESGIFELDSDSDVQRYLGNKPIKRVEDARKSIEFIRQQYLDNGIGRWAVIEKETNCFVGWAGLKFVREATNNHINYHDLGYRLIKKYWGKGYATESAKASLDYGFEKLKLKEIYSMADVNNIASRKVLEKVGLKLLNSFDLNGVAHNWFRISKA
ncbi:RimJ/RimL family protein N-acetyltransferase [Pontibacter aydingkolensis]|uniref:GNAT family N-acetyltransferase n=1 Tax=Pontibacter aydingkolensis TaxID=1911536 RepID=A0ABS7CRY1_9BACT|nr:GNAT family N-acetyltransferase [Pontibacter aydingkolensis]MBW7466604.1 GNAT family N-acetyltransferase [Pontibacter aydingkolensis]